jgi:hypothetical protein
VKATGAKEGPSNWPMSYFYKTVTVNKFEKHLSNNNKTISGS